MKSQVFAEAAPRFVLLAVDDKPDNLYVLKQLVAASLPECTLVGAGSVEEGLRKARETPFDGILLDVQMSGMDGVEMCRRLKSEEATRESPVILITSHQSSPKLRAAGLEAGADDFIARPIDNVELAARIRTMLRIRSVENEFRRVNRDLEGIVAERTRQIEKAMRRQVIRNDRASSGSPVPPRPTVWCIASRITGLESPSLSARRCSRSSTESGRKERSKGAGWGYPRCGESWSATADGSGWNRAKVRAAPSSSPCPKPEAVARPMLTGLRGRH